MLAFVDESSRIIGSKRRFSLGFFVTRDFATAYSVLKDEYEHILSKYSIRIESEELKFSNILNALTKRIGQITIDDIVRIFWPLATKISSYGYPLAFVFNKYRTLDIVPTIKEYLGFLDNPKARKRIGAKMRQRGYRPSSKIKALLSTFLFVHKLFNNKKVIVDQKLLERSGLGFINIFVRELGFQFSVEYYSPQYERGIALADFVAGYSKYLTTINVVLTTEPITVFRWP